MFEEDPGGEGGLASLDIRRTSDGVTEGPKARVCGAKCSGCTRGARAEDVCQLTYILGRSLWPFS